MVCTYLSIKLEIITQVLHLIRSNVPCVKQNKLFECIYNDEWTDSSIKFSCTGNINSILFMVISIFNQETTGLH